MIQYINSSLRFCSASSIHITMTLPTTAYPTVLVLPSRWLVVSKPSDWLTIPGRGSSPALSGWPKKKLPPVWVGHRLDLEASGVVLYYVTVKTVARTHHQANFWFEKRQIKKVYHCIAAGRPHAPVFKMSDPIAQSPSTTLAQVRESYGSGFFAKVMPQTRRRHQIRVHLSSKEYPIWGDTLYHGPRRVSVGSDSVETERAALHASSLELPSGEPYEAPFPENFQYFLEQLRESGQK